MPSLLKYMSNIMILGIDATSSFSISSENDETVNANSGHVSWVWGVRGCELPEKKAYFD